MMNRNDVLMTALNSVLHHQIDALSCEYEEVTLVCRPTVISEVLSVLRDHPDFLYDQLVDLCGVDYLYYGIYDWETNEATEQGFSRGVARLQEQALTQEGPRFAVVYHLLSTQKNHRLRVRVYLGGSMGPPVKPGEVGIEEVGTDAALIIPSVCHLYQGANWFEREAYDLYGILFDGHPDLRRILTDYGFIGHPFRKDFPLVGQVEMRYDAALKRVIYVPVDIVPRVLVPKVIREDHRYLNGERA